MSKSTKCGMIVNAEHQFSIWRTQRRPPSGWRFTGTTGTAAEMVMVLLQQFVETAPAIPIPLDTPFSGSQWADTESDEMLMPGDGLAGSDLLAR